jgi:hypothetical protein
LSKRNRLWEKQHQSRKVVYRGVDPKLSLKVKSIAGDLCLPDGQVACTILEFALRSYEQGDVDLHPRVIPYRTRRTLFADSDATRLMPSRKRKRSISLWKVITTWRGFSPELKGELSALASPNGLNVPVGELITVLLRFGLAAYDHGLIRLDPLEDDAALRN